MSTFLWFWTVVALIALGWYVVARLATKEDRDESRKHGEGYVGVAPVHHIAASPLGRARRRAAVRAVDARTRAEQPGSVSRTDMELARAAARRAAEQFDDDEGRRFLDDLLKFPPNGFPPRAS